MHGLVNRAIQRFAEDTYGLRLWTEVIEAAAPRLSGFEAMLTYPDALTERVLAELCARTGTPRQLLLEDIGTYLVSHPATRRLRRLLRFGGESFPDFLDSLEELPDRVRLAVPDLVLPEIELVEHAPGRYLLRLGPGLPGLGHVLTGLLRAVADDYGALAFVEPLSEAGDPMPISVMVAANDFSAGQAFRLVEPEGAR